MTWFFSSSNKFFLEIVSAKIETCHSDSRVYDQLVFNDCRSIELFLHRPIPLRKCQQCGREYPRHEIMDHQVQNKRLLYETAYHLFSRRPVDQNLDLSLRLQRSVVIIKMYQTKRGIVKYKRVNLSQLLIFSFLRDQVDQHINLPFGLKSI